MNIDTIGYNAAIGWLARENKILIAENEEAKDLIISLA